MVNLQNFKTMYKNQPEVDVDADVVHWFTNEMTKQFCDSERTGWQDMEPYELMGQMVLQLGRTDTDWVAVANYAMMIHYHEQERKDG